MNSVRMLRAFFQSGPESLQGQRFSCLPGPLFHHHGKWFSFMWSCNLLFGSVSFVPGDFQAGPGVGISQPAQGGCWGCPVQGQQLDFNGPCGSLPAQDLL